MKKVIQPGTASYKKISEGYRDYLQALGYKPQTINSWEGGTREFLYWLEQSGIKEINEVTARYILLHKDYLEQRPQFGGKAGGLSSSAIHQHLQAIRTMFDYLQHVETINEHPMNSINLERPQSESRIPLSISQVKELYHHAATPTEKAILSLLYGCGLRIREASDLNTEDVKLRTGIVMVRNGKGSKSRSVPMSSSVKESLQYYLEEDRKARQSESAVLICNWGTRMNVQVLANRLRIIIKRSGIKDKVSAHVLRHSIATHLLAKGMKIEQVRDFLGHSSLESTQIYTHVYEHQLQDGTL